MWPHCAHLQLLHLRWVHLLLPAHCSGIRLSGWSQRAFRTAKLSLLRQEATAVGAPPAPMRRLPHQRLSGLRSSACEQPQPHSELHGVKSMQLNNTSAGSNGVLCTAVGRKGREGIIQERADRARRLSQLAEHP